MKLEASFLGYSTFGVDFKYFLQTAAHHCDTMDQVRVATARNYPRWDVKLVDGTVRMVSRKTGRLAVEIKEVAS